MWWFVQLLNVWLFEMDKTPKLSLMCEAFSQPMYNKVQIFWEGHKNLKQYLNLFDVT